MYVNVPRVALKLEDHSLSGRSGKDTSTTSKDAKRWGCIQTSLKRGGVRQLKTSCSRPYIGRFNPCKSGAPWAPDNRVSSLICDKRFRFFKTIKQLFIVCLNLTRERTVGNPCEIDGHTVNVKEFANGTLGVMLNEFAFEF